MGLRIDSGREEMYRPEQGSSDPRNSTPPPPWERQGPEKSQRESSVRRKNLRGITVRFCRVIGKIKGANRKKLARAGLAPPDVWSLT